MTMSSDQYETGNSSVKISDGAKGSTVEVKVYAKPLALDENVDAALGRIREQLSGVPGARYNQGDFSLVTNYISKLRAAAPDVPAAAKLVKATHLELAAGIERNGGVIVYDPEQRLLAAWEQMEEHDAEAK